MTKNVMRFIAHLEDGSSFAGSLLGSIESGWNKIPDQRIFKLEYVLPFGDSLILSGYDEYLHMVEVAQTMGHRPVVEFVYLMGKRRELFEGQEQVVVRSYRLTVIQRDRSDRFKIGDITCRVYRDGTEYMGGATAGWKQGVGVNG